MLRRLGLFLALTLAPLAAHASKADTVNRVHLSTGAGSRNLLDTVACDAVAASRTLTLTHSTALARTELAVFVTYDALTSVEITPWCSLDGLTYARYTTESCTSGVCTTYAMSRTQAIAAADLNYKSTFDTAGCLKSKFVFSCTGGATADKLTVQGVSLTGGE